MGNVKKYFCSPDFIKVLLDELDGQKISPKYHSSGNRVMF